MGNVDFSPQQGNTLFDHATTINNVDATARGNAFRVVAPIEVHVTPASAPAIPEGMRPAPENPAAPGHNGSEGIAVANGVDPRATVLDPIQGHIGKTVAPVQKTLRPTDGGVLAFRNPA
jgi:hypothetical protein